MRVRPYLDEFAEAFGFSPTKTSRGYLYKRRPLVRVNQFLLFENSRLGLRAYMCNTIFDRWENELGGTAASKTVQLRYLKVGPNSIEALTYRHSGTEDSVRSAIDMMRIDYISEAEPWFKSCLKQSQPGHLLFEGLAWLDNNADRLTSRTWVELEQSVRAVNYSVPRVSHPLFDELKSYLQGAYERVDSTKAERQSMPNMALKLLEYGCQSV